MGIITPTYKKIRFVYLRKALINKPDKIVITGCGRSGTRYITKLLNKIDVRIGHETLRRNGISSWYLVPESSIRIWGPSYNDIKHLNMPFVHQVRHPLKVISSTQKMYGQKSWDYIKHILKIDRKISYLELAMIYWVKWNKMAEQKSVYTYRVEDIEKVIPKIFEIGNIQLDNIPDDIFKSTSKKINTIPHKDYDWNDMLKENETVTHEIIELANKYGYNISL